jgi:hypothetical protein
VVLITTASVIAVGEIGTEATVGAEVVLPSGQ